jgi:hypothetical protein
MPMRSIQRRLSALEDVMADALAPEYRALTPSEVGAIARRFHSGEKLTRTELNRLERQSPIIDGELLMTCHRRRLTVKRYVGVDLAEI